MFRLRTVVISACALLLCTTTVARADYVSDFDGLTGSTAGFPLTGQDGYYLPPGTDSVDFMVYPYSGNALGFSQNPEGGSQFIGGRGPGTPTFARAQRDVDFGDGTQTWTMTYDFAGKYLGTGPSANNLGSVSIQPDADYIHLFSWVDPDNPTNFNALYLAYDAAGIQFAQPGGSPGPEWENLELDHWYRSWIMFDLATNQIIEVGIVDLDTGTASVANPPEWYLFGGAGGGGTVPPAFRFFAGGGVPDNALGFDNIRIELMVPTPVKETSWGRLKNMYR